MRLLSGFSGSFFKSVSLRTVTCSWILQRYAKASGSIAAIVANVAQCTKALHELP